jgi:hypothetical protein
MIRAVDFIFWLSVGVGAIKKSPEVLVLMISHSRDLT